MNSTIYLFGKLSQGITASVNDYTQTFFEKFISKANAPTQIIIHRDADVMNYAYIRKIENGQLFGICMQINGEYLHTIDKLFEIFETIIANMAVKGDILFLNKQGNLEAKCSNLLDNTEQIDRVVTYSQNEFHRLNSVCRTLPDIDFTTTDSDVNYFKQGDNINIIIKASVKNGYTFIYKERDYDTLSLSGYRSTLSELNKANEAYKRLIYDQEKKLKVLERKKKQIGLIAALLVIFFLITNVFLITIDEKNTNIKEGERTIAEQKKENYTLHEENKVIHKEKISLQNRINDLIIELNSTNLELDSVIFEYQKLQSDHNTLEYDIKILKNKNISLESENSTLSQTNLIIKSRLKESDIKLSQSNDAYKTLQDKYDIISKKLTLIENKYYSTKEGKKALKR